MAKIDRKKPIVEMDDLERELAFDELGLGSNKGLLDDARGPAGLAPMNLAVVVLAQADGTKRVLYYTPEYGDNEGWEDAQQLLHQVRGAKLLKDGERLLCVLVEVPLSREVVRGVEA